jgi:hypothetical protein
MVDILAEIDPDVYNTFISRNKKGVNQLLV